MEVLKKATAIGICFGWNHRRQLDIWGMTFAGSHLKQLLLSFNISEKTLSYLLTKLFLILSQTSPALCYWTLFLSLSLGTPYNLPRTAAVLYLHNPSPLSHNF
jgi:hypothetical protein